jgi:hypothetical protein
LLPLEVGNTWRYSWTSTLTDRTPNAKVKVRGFQWHEYGENCMIAKRFIPVPPDHAETYTITSKRGDNYYFTVSSDPAVKGDERDGRYDDTVEMCWTWWTGTETGLTETIKRNWDYPSKGYLLGSHYADVPAEKPTDNRNVVHIKKKGVVAFAMMYGSSLVYDYNLRGTTVTVPAGTFRNCVEVTEKVYKKEKGKKPKLEWETHTFWAPMVGMVRDYQQLPDGIITYDMKLTRYTVGGVTKPLEQVVEK